MYAAHVANLPWPAVPQERQSTIMMLFEKYKIKRMPRLVILDNQGQVVNEDAISAVLQDPEAQNYPWSATISDLLDGVYITNDRKKVPWSKLRKSTAIGIFCGASWEPSTIKTLVLLRKAYRIINRAGQNFEIVFVSADHNLEGFASLFCDMPWLAIPFNDRTRIEAFRRLLKLGIPCLHMIEPNGRIITTEGETAVACDARGVDFPWYPKIGLKNLKDDPGALLHGPCLVVFLEEVPQKFKYERSLSNLAKQLAKRGVLEHISFFVATEITGMSEQLRNLIRFKSPPTELQAVIVDLSRDSGPAVFHHTASCVPEIKHPLSEFIEEYINAFANNDLEFQKLLPLG